VKKAFFQLPDEKRAKVLGASLGEFGSRDFEGAALDRIVAAAGISKGGLYEYIESKEDLYLFVVEHSYARLYDHILLGFEGESLPADILERFMIVAERAIGFYLANPDMIGVIVRSASVAKTALGSKVEAIFRAHFNQAFDGVSSDNLRFPRERLFELITWLLVKTRNDFLARTETSCDIDALKREYLEEWRFIISVCESGIYQEGHTKRA
jgi:AcrR family transcriptional regulator